MREEIADIIMYKLKDPRIGFITVTGVDMTPDLKIAKVFVSILEEGRREDTIEILNAAKTFIRSVLKKRLRMKCIPAIDFNLDASLDYGSKIDSLLKKIKDNDEGS